MWEKKSCKPGPYPSKVAPVSAVISLILFVQEVRNRSDMARPNTIMYQGTWDMVRSRIGITITE